MPLAGGAADKIGNRYESRWTVRCLLQILAADADSIQIEVPGDEGKGAEFLLRRSQVFEYHQVKRQQAGSGHWTLNQLGKLHILQNFWSKLADPSAVCVFVSTQAPKTLNELVERARQASSVKEYKQEFLSNELALEFTSLCKHWDNCTEVTAFEALKRVEVRTIDERSLEDLIESQCELTIQGESSTAAAVLAQVVINSVHHTLDSNEIWSRSKLQRAPWSELDLEDRLFEAASRYEASQLSFDIGGICFVRSEASVVMEALRLSSHKTIMVTGEGGVGKSGVMRQVIARAQAEGWLVLPVGVNNFRDTNYDGIGPALGLPGSPIAVLASAASNGRGLLVLDQLDFVSQVSGRDPVFFEEIDRLLRHARSQEKLSIVVGCRRFDMENDPRFRVLAELPDTLEVRVGTLEENTVTDFLMRVGYPADALTPSRKRLLCVPLHLRILADLMAADGEAPSFSSFRELLDQFWLLKERNVRERLGPHHRWSEFIDFLCEDMSSHRRLWSTTGKADVYQAEAAAMASEGVIVANNNRISFFHESFFDYAFARRFVADNRSLPDLLMGSEQHLFRRAQVRQILDYRRQVDFDMYLVELQKLLSSDNIRFHIKKVVCLFLREVVNPSCEEWRILALLFEHSDETLKKLPRIAAFQSHQWFQVLYQSGFFEILLNGDEIAKREAVWILANSAQTSPDDVLLLLRTLMEDNDDHKFLVDFLSYSKYVLFNHEYEVFFLELVRKGIPDRCSDHSAGWSFWECAARNISAGRPEFKCRAIKEHLEWLFKQTDVDLKDNRSHVAQELLEFCAKTAPKSFVSEVLPTLLQIMKENARGDEAPYKDSIWEYRTARNGYCLSDHLLQSMEIALGKLANMSPEDFIDIVSRLAVTDFETAHYLTLHGFSNAPSGLADNANEYLLSRSWIIDIGYSGARHFLSAKVIAFVSKHCTSEKLTRLEKFVLDLSNPKGPVGDLYSYRALHRRQWQLLEAFTEDKRSSKITKRLQELRRRFSDEKLPIPQPTLGGFVGSPIETVRATKMTNDDWLKAVVSYNSDGIDHFSLTGGANQLARVLEGLTKQEPARFANLCLDFRDDVNECYFDAVIRGLQKSNISIQLVECVCTRVFALPVRPCGRAVVFLLNSRDDTVESDILVSQLVWYATKAEDPIQELWKTRSDGGDVYYGGDPHSQGINSVRGAAAESLGKILLSNEGCLRGHPLVLKQIIADPSMAVRSCAAYVCLALLRSDSETAVALFLDLLDEKKLTLPKSIWIKFMSLIGFRADFSQNILALLKTHNIERFFQLGIRDYFDVLRPALKKMVNSRDDDIVLIGARLATLAALHLPDASDLAKRCARGSPVQRRGAAQVYASNYKSSAYRPVCEVTLKLLFEDEDENVREAASKCFPLLPGADFTVHEKFATSYLESRAFKTTPGNLIRALDKATNPMPEIVCKVARKLLKNVGNDAGDNRLEVAGHVFGISKLVLRAYNQAREPSLQTQLLDVIDQLTKVEVSGIDNMLDRAVPGRH